MEPISISFVPSWETDTRKDVSVTLSKTRTGFEFKCDELESDCAHPISLEQLPEFMAEIGAPGETNLRKAILRLVEQGHAQKIYSAVHKVLPPSFVWDSSDWD